MLRNLKSIHGSHVEGRDGVIGNVTRSVIDVEHWTIRYLVVDAGSWWVGHEVLISPMSVHRHTGDVVRLDLSRGRVEGHVTLDAHNAVPATDLDLRLTNSRIETLIPISFKGSPPVTGSLVGRAKLSGRGNSVHKTFAGANGDVVLVAVRRNHGVEIDRVDVGTGKAAWTGSAFADADRVDFSSIDTDADRAYVPSANKLLALALTNGKLAWEVELPDARSSRGWVVRAGKSCVIAYPAEAIPAEPPVSDAEIEPGVRRLGLLRLCPAQFGDRFVSASGAEQSNAVVETIAKGVRCKVARLLQFAYSLGNGSRSLEQDLTQIAVSP